MAEAGLTLGTFYAYFESKSDLYEEILGCFFTHPNWRSRWEGVDVDLASSDAGQQIVRAYLSQQHFDDVANSCPMVALPCDVCAQRSKGQDGSRECVQSNGSVLGRDVKNTTQPPEDTAMAIAGLCSLNNSRLGSGRLGYARSRHVACQTVRSSLTA
jgi:TetR/AcrR family transcriptional regulator, transcriptional repressor for nem operon